MTLFSDCMLYRARKLLDTLEIVRERRCYDNKPLDPPTPLYDHNYLQIDKAVTTEHNPAYGFGHVFLLLVAWNSVSYRLFT
jgi:hypothetical protein